jgi:hypothetical protein
MVQVEGIPAAASAARESRPSAAIILMSEGFDTNSLESKKKVVVWIQQCNPDVRPIAANYQPLHCLE